MCVFLYGVSWFRWATWSRRWGEHVDGGVHELAVFQYHFDYMLIAVPLGTHANVWV